MIAVFLITLGLGQFLSTWQGWRTASLVGPRRWAGYGLSGLLIGGGGLLLPDSWGVLGWSVPAAPLVLALLLLAGSYIDPPPHPDCLFDPHHPAHGGCLRVQIPDGDYLMPGYLLTPPYPPQPSLENNPQITQISPIRGKRGVLLVHGAGDTKSSYKWRLVEALLVEGLVVLTIDLPGHGDYRQRPLAYPDCLSAIPAALRFLRAQPGVERVGLVGISLGSALALASLAQYPDLPGLPNLTGLPLAALETPIALKYSRAMFYGEMWHAYRAPVLSLFREVSVKQLRQSWFTGGYVSRHKNTAEVIELLNPLEHIAKLGQMAILLVHGERDGIAPPTAGRTLRQAAPQAELWEVKGASHVTLTLMRETNRRIARWVRERVVNSE